MEQSDIVDRLTEGAAHCGMCGAQAVEKNSRDQYICTACLYEVLPDYAHALRWEAAAEITRLRAALDEKVAVKVKPLVFNQRASGWWAMSPFGFYVVAPTKTDNGDQWGIWYPETDTEDDPDGYASNECAAMAVVQSTYESRILSAVEAAPASQIRAEALREAAEVANEYGSSDILRCASGWTSDYCAAWEIGGMDHSGAIKDAILALIDAPKVTT